ncbi:MAG: DUF4389 domain-containing protein [bacterium]|nr:DUF4389 domain-containing protein [bacterium]
MEQATTTTDFSFNIVHQEKYSRGELLLRSFFGFLYIIIPHFFLLALVGIASGVLGFISWWAVLFTAKYPRTFFDFQVSVMRWSNRVLARIMNLSDGYPAFGMNVQDERVTLDIAYPERLSRGVLILRLFFSMLYVLIPHGFCLFFRMIGTYVIIFIAWWAVLFTGNYPKGMHEFVVGTFRWATRVNIYLSFMTDKYPPFSGK